MPFSNFLSYLILCSMAWSAYCIHTIKYNTVITVVNNQTHSDTKLRIISILWYSVHSKEYNHEWYSPTKVWTWFAITHSFKCNHGWCFASSELIFWMDQCDGASGKWCHFCPHEARVTDHMVHLMPVLSYICLALLGKRHFLEAVALLVPPFWDLLAWHVCLCPDIFWWVMDLFLWMGARKILIDSTVILTTMSDKWISWV